MRKCLDCGAELPDVAVACSECNSTNLSEITEIETEFKEKKSHFMLYVIGVVVVIAIIAGVLIQNYLSSSIPAKPVLEGVTASAKGDMDTYISKMYPKLQSTYEDAFLSMYESFSAYSDSVTDGYEQAYGKNYKVDVKTIDVSDISDVMVASICKEYYDSMNFDLEIDKAKYVTVGVRVYNDEGLESYTTQTLYSVEIDGDWYLFYDLLAQASENASGSTSSQETTSAQ